MIILAIDTCERHCSAALVDIQTRAGQYQKCLAQASQDIGRGHAERLIPMIDELLAATGLGYGDIDRIGVTTGPGTFTGLRVGLSVARGLALSLDIPCVGVTSLMVLAAQSDQPDQPDQPDQTVQVVQAGRFGPVHCVILGRGGQAFYQAFDMQAGLPVAQALPQGLYADEIQAKIQAQPGRMTGSGVSLLGVDMQTGAAADAAIDPVTVAKLAFFLEPSDHRPDPTYFRQADAVVGKAALPVGP